MRRTYAAALFLMALTGEIRAQTSWPPLPASGFITGRAATQADVRSGQAAFALAQGPVPVSTPLPLKIPQYAYLDDEGKRVPVILIQAEQARDMQVVGLLMADGTTMLAFRNQLVLLGTRPPPQSSDNPATPSQSRARVK
ncbi:hypothetical protein [Pseudomonas sp. CGJS7]|uniref:hypothetical protein n=1 Tax=Pseudomonas sp. CGJS7 TaxID=3109348 RepID=UPI0030090881